MNHHKERINLVCKSLTRGLTISDSDRGKNLNFRQEEKGRVKCNKTVAETVGLDAF